MGDLEGIPGVTQVKGICRGGGSTGLMEHDGRKRRVGEAKVSCSRLGRLGSLDP